MLDTNAVTALVKGRSPALERFVRDHSIVLSVVSEAEIRFGLARRPVSQALRRTVGALLETIEILPWNSDCARIYGELRAALEQRGKPLGPLDLLIASQAVATDCTLVTADAAFAQVLGLRVLQWSRDAVAPLGRDVREKRPAYRVRQVRASAQR